MAIPKVIGTETEYGIVVRNQRDFNPALASTMVVNSFPRRRVRVQWTAEEESPGRDARGFGFSGSGSADSDQGALNSVLTNGARFYVDHAHPEYATPECLTPREAALYDVAGELVMAEAAAEAGRLLEPGQSISLYKNNSDGKSNSYGSHENYLLARSLPFGQIVEFAPTFLVSRQILTGSGKVGSENGRPPADYQITQRADFFEEEVGLETTLKRPIINTRDEPHGDATKYRRLHVILADANLSEVQIFLKLGVGALFMSALEDGAIPDPMPLEDSVRANWSVSHDPSLATTVSLESGGTATALELQWQYFEWLAKYAESELASDWQPVLDTWEETLSILDNDVMGAADRLDWVAKLALLEGFRQRDGLDWSDPKLKALDLQYHDVDRAKSLHRKLVERGSMLRLFTDSEVAHAVDSPPETTRAYFRGECVARFGADLVACNWDSMVFDVGQDSLKRVPMMEPLRGTRELVGDLLDEVETAADLIAALGG